MDPAPQLIVELPMGSLEHLLMETWANMKYMKASQKQIMAMLRAGQEEVKGVVSAILSAQDHHKWFGDQIQGQVGSLKPQQIMEVVTVAAEGTTMFVSLYKWQQQGGTDSPQSCVTPRIVR